MQDVKKNIVRSLKKFMYKLPWKKIKGLITTKTTASVFFSSVPGSIKQANAVHENHQKGALLSH